MKDFPHLVRRLRVQLASHMKDIPSQAMASECTEGKEMGESTLRTATCDPITINR